MIVVMPPLLLTDLPKTKALVKASVLAVGLATATATAGCGDDGTGGGDTGPADTGIITDSAMDTITLAPTCGPCCHGGGPECDDTGAPPPPVDAGAADAASDAADAVADATTDAP